MKIEEVQAIIQFMQRVNMNAGEIEAYQRCMQVLTETYRKLEEEKSND